MKRAAVLFTAILSLLLIGYPSTPLHADSAPSSTSVGVGAGDDIEGTSGADNGTSGQNEGDADGLAGIRQRPGLYGDGDGIGIVLRTWWKILWLLR
jgi:hypothetical protein